MNPNLPEMNLIIRPENRIQEIQMEFNTLYPYLKVEFYRPILTPGKFPNRGQRIEGYEPVRKYSKIEKPCYLALNSTRTIYEVESDFQNVFALAAEIYRKSGNNWIETSLTDQWTLEHQNREGELLSGNHS